MNPNPAAGISSEKVVQGVPVPGNSGPVSQGPPSSMGPKRSINAGGTTRRLQRFDCFTSGKYYSAAWKDANHIQAHDARSEHGFTPSVDVNFPASGYVVYFRPRPSGMCWGPLGKAKRWTVVDCSHEYFLRFYKNAKSNVFKPWLKLKIEDIESAEFEGGSMQRIHLNLRHNPTKPAHTGPPVLFFSQTNAAQNFMAMLQAHIGRPM